MTLADWVKGKIEVKEMSPERIKEVREKNKQATLESTHHEANRIANGCSDPGLGDVKKLLKYAKNLAKSARVTNTWTNYTKMFGDAGDRIGQVVEEVEQDTKTVVLGVSACQINDAIQVLLPWSNSQRGGPTDEDAAHAFDLLFAGIADWVGAVPAPLGTVLKPYAQIFKEIGKNEFFVEARKKYSRWSDKDSSERRQLKESNESGGLQPGEEGASVSHD